MQYRNFGRDNIRISEMGLGCWQLGADWGEVSVETARSILNASVEKGVNFFDTADVYGDGRSEEIIGDFLKSNKKDIFVATKVGRSGGLFPGNYTEQGVTECVENSLKRLRTDALDLVQLHCIPAKVMKEGEIFEWLRKLKTAGKIKRFGASVESMDEALMCIENNEDLYSLQIIFNIFRQKPIKALFKKAKETNTGIISRVPLASGLLTGKMTRETLFHESDHRNYNRDGQAFNVGETFAGIPFEKGVELSSGLLSIIPGTLTMVQTALRWILDFKEVSVVIPGASKSEQAINNAGVSDLPPLSKDLHRRLELFYKIEVHNYIRGPY